MSQHNEITFEQEICDYLAAHGWLYSANDAGYDKRRALFPEDVFGWLAETQPEEYAKVVKPSVTPEAQAKAQDALLDRLVKVLDQGQPLGGTLQVLRKGFKHTPATFTMLQTRPELGGNPTTASRYAANRLRVMRQVHYSTKNNNSIDLVLFLNGIPVATVELKTDFTQSVDDAIAQYRFDRSPVGEPLLGFGTRALVHFAVSNAEVQMTTRLAGKDTRFLPFNRGDDGHAGNPPDPSGTTSPTAYLWQDIWARDRWIDIIASYMHYVTHEKTNPDTGRTTKSHMLIFPRYHQLDAVTQMEAVDGFIATINSNEAGKKSFSSKSAYLASVLAQAKNIIVVTMQTFPFVLAALKDNVALKDRRFAVIADEAHSGQTGQAATQLKQVLASELSEAEAADLADGGDIDVETVLSVHAKNKAETPNISFFAFTATPKAKTLENFGTYGSDGLPRPFHLYTMAQAIEERFILDVLTNYTSYKTAFKLACQVRDGQTELVDESEATKRLLQWVRLHPTNIAQKVEIIVNHFETQVKHLLGGTAKAMVVTDSRKAAVKYKKAMDAYIESQLFSSATSLVAFSGEVAFTADDVLADGLEVGVSYAESNLNPGANDLRKAFDTGEYRVMIVANKFQTGFDQPKLCAMYVDKPLAGVAAVQTLSRLNRYVPGKTTMVLDFVKDPDEILAAFQQYYREASLVSTTDPNLIHDLGTKLETSGLYTLGERDALVDAYVRNLGNNALAGALAPVRHRYVAAYNAAAGDKERRAELDLFRKDVSAYVRLHDFLGQMINFGDTDVERNAIFFRHLAPQLRMPLGRPDIDLSEVELSRIAQRDKGKQDLVLEDEDKPMRPTTGAGSRKTRDPRRNCCQKSSNGSTKSSRAKGSAKISNEPGCCHSSPPCVPTKNSRNRPARTTKIIS